MVVGVATPLFWSENFNPKSHLATLRATPPFPDRMTDKSSQERLQTPKISRSAYVKEIFFDNYTKLQSLAVNSGETQIKIDPLQLIWKDNSNIAVILSGS